MSIIPDNQQVIIGSLIFPGVDQLDFTGPFEVLSRIPNVSVHVVWKDTTPVADAKGLILTPQTTFDQCPQVDVLHIPGGFGQQALMDDEIVLSWIKSQAADAKYVLSVCTGALICGAAGLLKGRRATTHWASFDLLKYFGAIPVKARSVLDQSLMTAAGVTAGIDASLELVALLRGPAVAQRIQLYLEYAPEPPFNSGTPETAPSDVFKDVQDSFRIIHEQRQQASERVAKHLSLDSPI